MSNELLANQTVAALVTLYNGAIEDFNPQGFEAVNGFKSKAKAIEAIEQLCEAGSLAVNFEGESAIIVDAMQPETGDDEDGDDDTAEYGDGAGEVSKSGFHRASDGWLKANERGSEAREAYRKARRKAARMARKAARAAKEAAQEAVTA